MDPVALDTHRPHWYSALSYVLAVIGAGGGFASFFRLPFMILRFGCGNFLVAYVLSTVLLAGPLCLTETFIGQHFRKGVIESLRNIHPRLKGLGYVQTFVGGFVVMIYTAAVVSYSAYAYFIASFFEGKTPALDGKSGTYLTNSTPGVSNLTRVSTEQSRLQDYFLGNALYSDTYTNYSAFACLLLCWLLSGLLLIKGVRSLTFVVYIAVPIPVVTLLGLTVFSVSMPGAGAALARAFALDWDVLFSFALWGNAIGHSFLCLQAGTGASFAFGSYTRPVHNVLRIVWFIIVQAILHTLLVMICVGPVLYEESDSYLLRSPLSGEGRRMETTTTTTTRRQLLHEDKGDAASLLASHSCGTSAGMNRKEIEESVRDDTFWSYQSSNRKYVLHQRRRIKRKTKRFGQSLQTTTSGDGVSGDSATTTATSEEKRDLDTVLEHSDAGFHIAYVVYPFLLNQLKWASPLSIFFFGCSMILGIQSMASANHAVTTVLRDKLPFFRSYTFLLAVCFLGLILGIPWMFLKCFVFLHALDAAIVGMCLPLLATFECLGIGYLWADRNILEVVAERSGSHSGCCNYIRNFASVAYNHSVDRIKQLFMDQNKGSFSLFILMPLLLKLVIPLVCLGVALGYIATWRPEDTPTYSLVLRYEKLGTAARLFQDGSEDTNATEPNDSNNSTFITPNNSSEHSHPQDQPEIASTVTIVLLQVITYGTTGLSFLFPLLLFICGESKEQIIPWGNDDIALAEAGEGGGFSTCQVQTAVVEPRQGDREGEEMIERVGS